MSDCLVDPKSHELAEHFLGDDDVPRAENELRIQSLAQAIQRAVEDWIEDESERDPRAKVDDDGREYADPRDFRAGRE